MSAPSREQLLAQLHTERYGDPGTLALEAYAACAAARQPAMPAAPVKPPERPEVLAARRFALMRGMADAHPPAGTWRRPVGAREDGAA